MQVEIRQFPELRVGAVRHVGPFSTIGDAFGRLGRAAGAAGLWQHPEAAMVGIYHDDPRSTPPEELRSDAGVVVGEKTTLPPELAEQRIPAGTYASALHVGSYEKLPDAWHYLMDTWLPSSGRAVGRGPAYEYYLNDPTTTPEADLKTEIRIPIANG